jgi:hypothetical protein
MPLKPEVLDRLLLSKSFLEKIRFQPVAIHDRHTLAANIIAAHDAAELAIAGVCDHLGCLPQKGSFYLMDYFESYRRARDTNLYAREYFRNLNSTRGLLKHQGLFPDGRQWSRVGETVFQHITKWCMDELAESFPDLDESALLLDSNVKHLYDEARESAGRADYKATLEKLALALSTVFENNVALRGFEAGDANTEDAIRVVGFGIHGNDFLALQQFLPHVARWREHAKVPRWKQSAFGHPGNWRQDSVEFCLRTFVDIAVKLQGAQWIPGPLSRDVLYDQQVEALNENVDFWRDVPDGVPDIPGHSWSAFYGKTKRETKQLLRKGEKLRAIVRRSTEGGAAAALAGGLLSVTLLDTGVFESWNVYASEVRVTCIPKPNDSVRHYFDWLPEIDWDPE